jgi:hypothetical protein
MGRSALGAIRPPIWPWAMAEPSGEPAAKAYRLKIWGHIFVTVIRQVRQGSKTQSH